MAGMPFKPNYNQQRAERERVKREKRDEKLRLQAERTAARKATDAPAEQTEAEGLSDEKN
jgi:hypothetical protein